MQPRLTTGLSEPVRLGSKFRNETMTPSLYDQLRRRISLDEAWRVVYNNGLSSKSEVTRKQITEFAIDANRHLNRICGQLRKKKFKFRPSEGVLAKKPGKSSKRPIVIAPIENRIVQRATLDALQSYPPLKPYFTIETSFGGIKERSVSDALTAVYTAMQSGSAYFIRSDIESFFTKIPKPTIIEIISNEIDDSDFLSLFESAIQVELSNMAELGDDRENFPIYDIGVAQGSCLSPLLGNILLNEFDNEMNQGDVKCFRYIDDFIILAPTSQAAHSAFRKGNRLLSKYGLTEYDPATNRDKAEKGDTAKGFSFLGCDIRPGMIRPNKKSQTRLVKSINDVFQKSLSLMGEPEKLVAKHKTVTETFQEVSNILKGWGNQYAFCNDVNLMKRIDEKMDEKIALYLARYSEWKNRHDANGLEENRRRLLGVHLLVDSKKKPIVPSN